MRIRLDELARRLDVPLDGDGSIEITGVAGIREAGPGDLTFLGHPKYEVHLAQTGASAIIMARPRGNLGIPVLQAAHPYLTFLKALKLFSDDRLGVLPGIHGTAVIGRNARFGAEVSIGPHAVLGDDVVLGDRVIVMAGVYVGNGARIGSESLLYPNVVIREDSRLGERVIVHSGAVIGSDGFGFTREGNVIHKIPQIGNVEIGDDVEIGANATIDRATTGTTRIGRGTRIDNLVMIAHNVTIGENSILCAQVGISGSTQVGNDVTLAGQVGLVGHIEIGDGVQVGAQGGVTKSIPAGTSVSGYPALPHGQARRIYAAMRHLPDMLREVRDLERRLLALETHLGRAADAAGAETEEPDAAKSRGGAQAAEGGRAQTGEGRGGAQAQEDR
ncbi:MAG: UDP-3-O-(3-hydroxymyristoyl)glucosamine N-acyltransferase [Candidatus Eisenbacteria bacterium]|nr:UDP-3-O-(3-hydroxymyristoyl)glucosamine N-acyltransferase [Candidatus Eisenbacteria bacterium]